MFLKTFAALAAMTLTLSAQASPTSVVTQAVIDQTVAMNVSPLNLINWNVGDQMDYRIKGGFINGTIHKEVTSDEGEALWFTQIIEMMGRKEVVDTLINKADGQILKIIRNGQPQEIPNEEIEIIEQNYAEVTVPAGTFESIHVVANTRDIKNLEVWMNPQATVMDGSLKQVLPTSMMTLTIELTSFAAGQ